MDELEVHIQDLMLREFKNNKNASESAKKLHSVCGHGIITDRQFQNWFSKFRSGDRSLRDKSKPGRSSNLDQDALNNYPKVLEN